MREGEAIGAIALRRLEPIAFTDKQVALLQTFADQAVIAIENTRLFNETKEALERQTATADILKVIASSPSDTTPVFEAIASSANQLLGGFSTAVFRFLDGTAYLAAFTPTNPAADEVLEASFPRPVDDFEAFRLARHGDPISIPDTEEMPHAQIRDIARLRGFRSMLFVPLMNGDVPIGIISVTRLETGSYVPPPRRTAADLRRPGRDRDRECSSVRRGAGQDTRPQEALQQQTATADVLKVISRSAFDLETVLDALLSSACRLCDADIGTIRYKEGGEFRLAATFGCPPEWIEHFRRYSTKPDRSSVFGRTIVEGHIVHIPDLLADPDYNRPEAQKLIGFRAALGVPLAREGETFGVINLFRFNVSSFETGRSNWCRPSLTRP